MSERLETILGCAGIDGRGERVHSKADRPRTIALQATSGRVLPRTPVAAPVLPQLSSKR